MYFSFVDGDCGKNVDFVCACLINGQHALPALQSPFSVAIMGVRPPLPLRSANPYIKEHCQFLVFFFEIYS